MNKKRLFWDYKELHHLHELLHQHSTPTSAPTFLSPPPCCAFNQFTSLVFRTHQGSQQTVLRMSSLNDTSHPTTQVIRIDLRRTYLMPAGKVHVLIIIVIIIIIIIDDTSHPMLLALQMADMHMGRGSLCTAMQGFMLWAVGGRDSHTFHNSTECFHAGQNRWTPSALLPQVPHCITPSTSRVALTLPCTQLLLREWIPGKANGPR